MTDTDIVAELRRLWEKAPQGKWEYSGPFDDGDEAGWIETRDENGDVWPVVGIGIDRPEVIDLIVAMHEALPALLDLAEAELGIPANRKAGIEGEETDEWWAERTRLYELRKSALAKLKQGGAE